MNASVQVDPPAEPAPVEGWGPGAIGAVLLGVVLAIVMVIRFLVRRSRPLPMDRLPEVARRQRMKGL